MSFIRRLFTKSVEKTEPTIMNVLLECPVCGCPLYRISLEDGTTLEPTHSATAIRMVELREELTDHFSKISGFPMMLQDAINNSNHELAIINMRRLRSQTVTAMWKMVEQEKLLLDEIKRQCTGK